ncbi:nucleotide modification associated domain-containing protein [Brochothrix thermosphacta]|uniref:nucleotide modification associated domain-containing protein n=1 Tax=Brochothrix thermosphacta TaxID=2756 RepID=UPI000E70A471|nr:nucleotide modification associated domain-containing protein [Brochothrix thermosphacta]
MIYKGKEYKVITREGAKIGDLVHITELDDNACDIHEFITWIDDEYDIHFDHYLPDGSCFVYKGDTFKTYRYVKDVEEVEETPAPKEKNIPLKDSLRYSAFNTPAYKLKRSINKLYEEMSELIADKNENYGDSFSKQYQKYGMVSVEMRLNDKFMRLEQLVAGEKDKVGESIEDTLKDIIGYATLALIELEGEK